jgi:hypothetical protein
MTKAEKERIANHILHLLESARFEKWYTKGAFDAYTSGDEKFNRVNQQPPHPRPTDDDIKKDILTDIKNMFLTV